MATAGVTAAAVWVDVLPSTRNFGSSLAAQAAAGAAAAGKTTGATMGKSASQSFAATMAASGAAWKKTGASMAATGAAVSKKVTLPVVALGAAVLNSAGNFEQGMNRVRALTGATGNDFNALSEQAKTLGRTTQFSASEAADAMGFLAQAGFKTNDILGAMPSVLQLAAAAQMDLGSAADITSNILTGYGMNVDELGKANDVLVKAMTSANVDLTMLGESFKYVGPIAKGAGVSFEEAAAAIGLMGNAGIQGSMAGTGLRRAITSLLNPTKKQSDLLAELGINAMDADGSLRPLEDIVGQLETSGAGTAEMMALFGDRAGPAMAALVDQGSEALRNLTGELDASGGTAERIAETQMQGLKGGLTELKSAAEGLLIAIGESGALGVATNMIRGLTSGLQNLAQTAPWLLRVATVLGMVVAAAGPLLWMTGKLLGGFGKLATELAKHPKLLAAVARGFALVGTALKAVGLFMLTNPFGLVLTALGLLAVGLVLAWKHSETFRSVVIAAWEGIKNAAIAAWTGFLKPTFDGFMAGLRAVGNAAQWLWSTVLKPVFGFIGTAAKILAAVVLTILIAPLILAFKAAAAIVTWWWRTAVRPTFNAVAALATWLWNNALKPTFDFISAAWQALMTGIQLYWQRVGRPAWNAVAAAGRWLWNNILKPTFTAVAAGWLVLLEGIRQLWERVLKPTWNALQSAAQWMWRNVLQPIFDAIGRGWNALGTGIRWVWRNIIKPAWDALVAGLNWVRDRFRNIVDVIGRIWNELRGKLARPINFMINTVWNEGILVAWNRVREWIPGLPEAKRLQPIRWAQGGIHEDHRAQIAQPGSWRVWAEPETGGEAYIPLAQAKRQRSTDVLSQVADRFGLALMPKGNTELFADGGLWRRMWGVVSKQFPRARRTSDYRPGDPGYHGSGRAIDVAGPRPMDMRAMLNINQWLGRNFANSTQLIHTQRGAVNLLHGRPHTYNAGTRADHRDHVHWALENAAMLKGAKGSGGFMGWIGDRIRALVKRITDPLLNSMPAPPPQWRGVPKNLMTMIRDKALDFFLGSAGAGAAPGSGPVVDQVREVARKFGWGGGRQWNALYELIRRESSWNPRAQNPISSAYGLYQFLDSTWATVGGHKTSNPGLQAEFGNRYIRQRYGSPGVALSFHDRNNWYDQGGTLQPGWNLAYNGTRRPEPVLTDAQWRDISRAANGEGGARHYHLTVYDAGNNRIDLATQFKRLELQAGV